MSGRCPLPHPYAAKQAAGSNRNAQRQLVASMISAPTEGPVATPSAVIAPHLATVVVRRELGVSASKSPKEEGVTRAPPTPCKVRALITIARFGAAPTKTDEPPKMARPAQKSSRRPNRSANRPAGISSAAKAMVYEFNTHVRVPLVASAKLASKPGKATFMVEMFAVTR